MPLHEQADAGIGMYSPVAEVPNTMALGAQIPDIGTRAQIRYTLANPDANEEKDVESSEEVQSPEDSILITGPSNEELQHEEIFLGEIQTTEKDVSNNLRHYFGRATALKLLSREEELALMRDIIVKKEQWRTSVLTHDLAKRSVMAIYQNAVTEDAKEKMRTFETDDADSADSLNEELMSLLPELQELMREQGRVSRENIKELLQGTLILETALPHTKRIAEIIEKRKISNAKMKLIMRNMEALLLSFEGYEDHWEAPQQCPELEALIRENLVWPPDLKEAVMENRARFKQWNEVKDRMILANTRLVTSIAKYYRNSGLDFDDLISQGDLGLMKAVDKFEPERGFRFSTYATWWIRQRITGVIKEQSKTVRIPVNQYGTLMRIDTFSGRYAQDHEGQKPSSEVIEAALGLTPELVTDIMNAQSPTASINQNFVRDGNNALESIIIDKKAPNPLVGASAAERHEAISEALRCLSSRERLVIILRFGLGLQELPPTPENPQVHFGFDEEQYGISHSLEEIGQIFVVSRERIRQLEENALKKLKTSDHPLCYGLLAHSDNGTEAPRLGPRAKAHSDPRMNVGLVEIGIALDVVNRLARQRVFTVGDYLSLNEEDRMNMPMLGKKSIDRIEEAIRKLGVQRQNPKEQHGALLE